MLIVLRQTRKTFVDRLDFTTSVGHGEGGDYRRRIGLPGKGPVAVISDLGILRPDDVTKELVLTQIHPGVLLDEIRSSTGWQLRISPNLEVTPPPTAEELKCLRDLEQRTALAHGTKSV